MLRIAYAGLPALKTALLEGVASATFAVTNAAAAWSLAAQTPVLNEQTLIPLSVAGTVLGLSITATFGLARWMAKRERLEEKHADTIAKLLERIDELEGGKKK